MTTESNARRNSTAATNDSLRGVTVIVPAYNEEDGIGPVLVHLSEVMEGIAEPSEIILVNDGSNDGTANAAASVDLTGVRVLSHEVNRGYGAALKTGIRSASYSTIVIADADGTYPVDRIPDLLEILRNGDCDMAVGSRTGENVSIPLIRRPAKWGITKMAEIAAGRRIPDLNSGLRAFDRETARSLFGILPDGFSFTTTITLALLTNGLTVHYMDIDYHARTGNSKIRPIRDTWNFMMLIVRIALYFAPLKIFLPLAFVLAASSVTVGLYTHFVLDQLADVITVLLGLTALQTALVGMLAELVNKRLGNGLVDR
jgi:glycosyltransferase involved in cell wall biosynthesis